MKTCLTGNKIMHGENSFLSRSSIKKLSLVLCIVSLLIWWEIPAVTLILAIINGILIYKKYDGSVLCKVNIGLCILCLLLAIWNWDLHIGMQLLEWYNGQ